MFSVMSSFSSEKQKHVSFNDCKRKFLISDELERSACSSWNPFLYPFKETFNEIWKYSSQVGGIFRFKIFFNFIYSLTI